MFKCFTCELFSSENVHAHARWQAMKKFLFLAYNSVIPIIHTQIWRLISVPLHKLWALLLFVVFIFGCEFCDSHCYCNLWMFFASLFCLFAKNFTCIQQKILIHIFVGFFVHLYKWLFKHLAFSVKWIQSQK